MSQKLKSTVYLPPHLKAYYVSCCESSNKSFSKIIKLALDSYISKHAPELLPNEESKKKYATYIEVYYPSRPKSEQSNVRKVPMPDNLNSLLNSLIHEQMRDDFVRYCNQRKTGYSLKQAMIDFMELHKIKEEDYSLANFHRMYFRYQNRRNKS